MKKSEKVRFLSARFYTKSTIYKCPTSDLNFKLHTFQTASLTIDFDIFETPSSRSLKMMDTSLSLKPAFHARK